MDFSDFWKYVSDEEALAGTGFGLFSVAHFIWLAVLFTAVAICSVLYLRGGDKRRDNMRKCLALALVFIELIKQCVNSFSHVPYGFYLPLEICSLAEFAILLDSMWPNGAIRKQVLAFAFLPAAFMALIMPTASIYPAISFYAIHQLVMHALIVAYVVSRYRAKEIVPKYSGIWMSLAVISICIIPVYYINSVMNRDYMFLMDPAGNPILEIVWNLSGGKTGMTYILGLEVFVAIVMHIVYVLFRVLGRRGGGSK